MCVPELSCFTYVHFFATLWTVGPHSPLSMGFSRQDYQSGLPCPPPRHLPDPRIEPVFVMSPALAGNFFTTSTTWEAPYVLIKGGYLDTEADTYKRRTIQRDMRGRWSWANRGERPCGVFSSTASEETNPVDTLTLVS